MIQKVLDQGDKVPRKNQRSLLPAGHGSSCGRPIAPRRLGPMTSTAAHVRIWEEAERKHVGAKMRDNSFTAWPKLPFTPATNPVSVVKRLEASKDNADEL